MQEENNIFIDRLISDPSFRNWVLKKDLQDFLKWEQYNIEFPQHKQSIDEARKYVLLVEKPFKSKDPLDDIRALDKLERKISRSEWNKSLLKKEKSRFSKRVIYYAVASLAASFLMFFYIFSPSQQKEEYNEKIAFNEDGSLSYIEKSTGPRQLRTIDLPDGSIIKLNACSKIFIPDNYMSNRQIQLEGEAFFQIARNDKSPFKVKTREACTEVLGTEFNISSYAGLPTKIQVHSGIVKVNGLQYDTLPPALVRRKEAVVFQDGKVQESEFLEEDLIWQTGGINFHEDDISSIAIKLERRYGVTIEIIEPGTITEKLSATYPREGIENVLEGICYVMGLKYIITGDKHVIIKKKKMPMRI
ncbi:MAG: FecR family protein [Cyclobacteriaceae bacterium]|nr:FecR family protein [Cyclobacteriaceae bacterium]